MKPARTIAIALLVLVAAGHVLRLLLQLEIAVNRVTVPMWPSILAIIVFLGVAVALWRDSQGKEV